MSHSPPKFSNLSLKVRDTLHTHRTVVDTSVTKFGKASTITAILVSDGGMPSPEAMAQWDAAVALLRELEDQALEGRTVEAYRRLPSGRKALVGRLIEELSR